MTKTKKPTKKRTTTAETTVPDPLGRALAYIDRCIQDVIDGRAPRTKHDPPYRVATLARMAAQVRAELRKQDAAEQKRLEKVTRPLVVAFARTLSPQERVSLAKEILAIDQEGSILA